MRIGWFSCEKMCKNSKIFSPNFSNQPTYNHDKGTKMIYFCKILMDSIFRKKCDSSEVSLLLTCTVSSFVLCQFPSVCNQWSPIFNRIACVWLLVRLFIHSISRLLLFVFVFFSEKHAFFHGYVHLIILFKSIFDLLKPIIFSYYIIIWWPHVCIEEYSFFPLYIFFLCNESTNNVCSQPAS